MLLKKDVLKSQTDTQRRALKDKAPLLSPLARFKESFRKFVGDDFLNPGTLHCFDPISMLVAYVGVAVWAANRGKGRGEYKSFDELYGCGNDRDDKKEKAQLTSKAISEDNPENEALHSSTPKTSAVGETERKQKDTLSQPSPRSSQLKSTEKTNHCLKETKNETLASPDSKSPKNDKKDKDNNKDNNKDKTDEIREKNEQLKREIEQLKRKVDYYERREAFSFLAQRMEEERIEKERQNQHLLAETQMKVDRWLAQELQGGHPPADTYIERS
jgi:hypothetical protein